MKKISLILTVFLTFLVVFSSFAQIKEQNIIKKSKDNNDIIYPYFINEKNSNQLNSLVDSCLKSLDIECNNFLTIEEYKIIKNTENLLVIQFKYRIYMSCITMRFVYHRELYINAKTNKLIQVKNFEEG